MTVETEPALVLDPKQLTRIESVHRGFMYQHLYATGCLLTASGRVLSVRVERDDDIEVVAEGAVNYIQVKTRSSSLAYGDIEGALARFKALGDAHRAGQRTGEARFVFVCNATPSNALLQKLNSVPLPPDVSLVWPQGILGPAVDGLPAAWPDIPAAVAWCTQAAEKLPLRFIASESLVWKVAAHAALAASGTAPYQDHSFLVSELPTLFEQIIIQLQEFPEPLQHYRPLQDEPPLESNAHLRIISGFSGAGKTSWAAQSAAHAANSCVYYDAADTPPAALASALVRESAAQLRSATLPLERVLAPGATGLQSLRALDEALSGWARPPILVIDNAHKLPASELHQISNATKHFRLVLLCHPVAMIAELEALTGASREELKGWSLEDVASETTALGCRGPLEVMDRLRVLTSGYPLFVQGAAHLAALEYAGDLETFCSSLEHGTHGTATPQETILARVFETLEQPVRQAAGLLSLADFSLNRVEAVQLLLDCMGLEEASASGIMRQLRTRGLLQFSMGGRVRLHDALHILGKSYLQSQGAEPARKGMESLRRIVFKSLTEERNVSRLGAFARLLASLNELEPLIDLIGEELFHELGVIPEVIAALERALAAGQLTPEQQFWAHDGLVFAAMKHGGGQAASGKAKQSLEAMERLRAEGALTTRHEASLWMKRMLYEAEHRNAEGVMNAFGKVQAVIPKDRAHLRIAKYNAAHALFKLGKHEHAESMTQELVTEYYELLGIDPLDVVGVTQSKLAEKLHEQDADSQDIKHLADTLELLAMAQREQGNRKSLARAHAMRFYELAMAVDSVVRTGLDLVDDFVWIHDFAGARQVMEEHILPYVRNYKLTSKLLDARSLYAIVLGYSGHFDEAEREMQRIAPLISDAPQEMQEQFARQNALVAEMRVNGVPRQRQLAGTMYAGSPSASASARKGGKAGRNDPCPCGSGQKFKKCHGAS